MAILINDNTARVQYTATSGQTTFAVPFEFFENSDLKVYRNSTLQTITTHYTLTGAGVTGGGNLTFVSGVTLNDIISIVRDIPIKRVTDFPLSGPFNIAALNLQLDQLTAMVQEANTLVTTRVPLLAEFDRPSALSAIPTLANRSNKYFYWDANGNPAATSTALGVGYTASATNAILRTFESKLSDTFSVADFGTGTAAHFASAAAGAAGRVATVPFANNTSVLPTTYSDTVFEYNGTSVLRYDHTLASFGTAKKALRTQFAAAHSGSNLVAFNIEGIALGSGANGPSNADMGQNITIFKKGYGTGTAASGEIDGLTIFVRQDGPQGHPSGDPLSSDSAGILINTQNIGDVGFTAAIECATTNINPSTFAVEYQIQTQMGTMNMNGVGAPKYGFAAVCVEGVNTSAYHADRINGSFTNLLSGNGTFTNIINVPGQLTIDAAGNYSAITANWASGAWAISRPAGANSATTFLHRGTGALFLSAIEAASIYFGTSNVVNWEINSTGQFQPLTNLGQNIGAPTRRVNDIYGKQIDLGTTSTNGVIILSGANSPEGAVAANVGSLYLRTNGGAGTTFYVKETGTGNTGWAAK